VAKWRSSFNAGVGAAVPSFPAALPRDIQSREHHKHSLATEVLGTAGTLRLAARGYSMVPSLWPGDVLTIEAQSFDRVQGGDVVLFSREDRFYIHRMLRKDATAVGNRLITRGDSMPEPDAPVLPEQLLAKVVATEYGAGKVGVPACSAGCGGRSVWRSLSALPCAARLCAGMPGV